MPASHNQDIQILANQINEMLAKFNVPGIDPTTLVEEQHNNIEALIETAEAVNKGAYDVAAKQLELFRTASSQLLSMFSDTKLKDVSRAELAKRAFEEALTGSREITELAAKAGEGAFAISCKRMSESFEEFRKATSPRKDS